MPKKLKRLVVVDGNALIHRAYHALPPLTTKKGELVNAVYGFSTLLLKAIHDLKPEYVAVAFDLAAPTFRHQAYEAYKATRVKAPDDLYAQFDRVKEIVKALNIPIFTAEGYEADDVIGTLSKLAVKEGIETIIVTGDMDTLQLVNSHVKVYTMRRGFTDTVLYDEEAVKEKYGLTSAQFVDYKALKGDASDNIPGVDGIGEKTAASLIQAFGSLDKLYEYLENGEHPLSFRFSEALAKDGEKSRNEISRRSAPRDDKKDARDNKGVKINPRIRQLLIDGKKQAYQSKELSSIVCDIPLKFNLKEAATKNYDRQKAIELFQELEFRSLLPRLPEREENKKIHDQGSLFSQTKEVATQVVGANYKLVQTEQEFEELLSKLKKAKAFVIDTETDYLNGPVIGLSFSVKEGSAYYVPVTTKNLKLKTKKSQLPAKEILRQLKPILEDEKIAKIGHNMKYDYLTLRKEGITVRPLNFDTMIASYLLNPANRQHNLDAVAFTELGIEKIPLAELIGTKKLDSLASVSVETVAQYAAEDADIALRLYNIFKPQLEKDHLKQVFYELEMPLVPILAHMEEVGIKVDCEYLRDLSKRLTKRQEELIKAIYHEAGQEFNINSTQQLATILFDKLQLKHPDIKKTKTGISTAASELEKMRGMHPIIDLLFEYRELTKLLSTYIDTLPKMVNKNDRIHTSFNQTIAATGRLSSSDPGLQNIPIRTEVGRQIRKAFVAEKGHQLVSADYSQIDLRAVAHLSDDAALAKTFQEDRDIHQEVADTLKVDRRVAKTLNFAVLYGQGAYSTAGQLGIPMNEAKQIIDQYFATYKGVRRFLDKVLADARTKGYVETIFGRRRYVPEIHASNFSVRAAAERMAINMPVQGTSADIMKMAMIQICQSDLLTKHKAELLLQVHDELVFEVPEKEVEPFSKEVKRAMEQVYELKVPLRAEVKVGKNWGEMAELAL